MKSGENDVKFGKKIEMKLFLKENFEFHFLVAITFLNSLFN